MVVHSSGFLAVLFFSGFAWPRLLRGAPMIEVLKSDVGCVDSTAHRSVPHFLSQRLSLPKRPWAPTKNISVRVGIALVRVGKRSICCRQRQQRGGGHGLLRELSPGPLAPEARIMPLDQAAIEILCCITDSWNAFSNMLLRHRLPLLCLHRRKKQVHEKRAANLLLTLFVRPQPHCLPACWMSINDSCGI